GDTIYLPRGGVSIPTSIVKILKPDGTVLSSTGAVGPVDGTQTATLPVTGTYTVLVDGWQDAVGQMTLALSDEDAVIGRLSADQSDATTSDPDLSPAAPQPVAPTGLLAPGTYTTETWGNTEVGNDRGLEVVSSTDPGTFSVTGIVKDAAT